MPLDELKRLRGLLGNDYNNYARALDSSAIMAYLTEKKDTLYVNKKLAKFLGITFTKKYTGNPLVDSIALDDVSRYKQITSASFKDGVFYEVEYRLKCFDGKYRWIKEQGIPVIFRGDSTYKGYLVVCEDYNEKKKIEIQLQTSEERYRRLFETARDGILLLNSETGQITDVNPFLSELLGYSKEEILGKKLWEVGAFRNVRASKETFKSVQEMGYVRYDNLPLETKDGRLIEAGFVSNAYTEGVERVIQCNIRDMSEQKRADDHAKSEALLKQEKIKTSFIADVTHELRTPLAIIKGNVELALRADYGKEDVQETFSAINIEINHLAEMLSNLSILTNENQTFFHTMEKNDVNLKTLLPSVVKRLKKIAETRNINIILHDVPQIKIFGNSNYLEKLFSNIISNGIFYGKENGSVVITTELQSTLVVVTITDNGTGIADKDLPNIFERFFRTEKARALNHEGTGLGLAISKWIVEAHKGEIVLESTLNKGTKVIITLPVVL